MPQPAPPSPPVARSSESMAAAMEAMRNAAQRQLEQLTDQRSELLRQLGEAGSATEQASLTRRLESIDSRIMETEQQVASMTLEAARLRAEAAISTPRPPVSVTWPRSSQMPGLIGVLVVIFFLFPIAIGFARRLWRRGAGEVSLKLPADVTARLERLETGVDAIALEVERISEGQRFVTKLLAAENPRTAVPAPADDR